MLSLSRQSAYVIVVCACACVRILLGSIDAWYNHDNDNVWQSHVHVENEHYSVFN
jgi:hypothetical protein